MTTIDQILRQRAQKKLRDRLNESFEAALSECRLGYETPTTLVCQEGRCQRTNSPAVASASQCLLAALEALYIHLLPEFEDKYIQEFVTLLETQKERFTRSEHLGWQAGVKLFNVDLAPEVFAS